MHQWSAAEYVRVFWQLDPGVTTGVVRDHRPAVVLLDIVMPEKDGIETVKEILTLDPDAVIFTMSGRDEDYQEVARVLGARRGFMKPVSTKAVLAAIRDHMREQTGGS